MLVIQHEPGDLILCKGTLEFFISREQTCPFSLDDFYFRLMETTKTGKNKRMSLGRAQCVCDSRVGIGSAALWRWGTGLLLKLHLTGTAPQAPTAFSQENRGLLRVGWKSVWLGQGNGAHGKQATGWLRHFMSFTGTAENWEFLTCSFLQQPWLRKKGKKKIYICLQSRVTLNCI